MSMSAGETREPAELIAAIALQQDRQAFSELFDFYAPRLKAFLMKGGTSGEEAEDIAQETLINVWRKAAQFDPARASAAAWIYTIARNLRIDRHRKQARSTLQSHYLVLEEEEPVRPDEELDAVQRAGTVRRALEDLSDAQVNVVRLSFFEGLAHADIARRLDIPLGTVKSRLRLAMNTLRKSLGDHI